MDAALKSEEFRWGVDLFNFGYYWEAHEAWEALWQTTREAPEQRAFLHALILLLPLALSCGKERPWLPYVTRNGPLACSDRYDTSRASGLQSECCRRSLQIAPKRTRLRCPPSRFGIAGAQRGVRVHDSPGVERREERSRLGRTAIQPPLVSALLAIAYSGRAAVPCGDRLLRRHVDPAGPSRRLFQRPRLWRRIGNCREQIKHG